MIFGVKQDDDEENIYFFDLRAPKIIDPWYTYSVGEAIENREIIVSFTI